MAEIVGDRVLVERHVAFGGRQWEHALMADGKGSGPDDLAFDLEEYDVPTAPEREGEVPERKYHVDVSKLERVRGGNPEGPPCRAHYFAKGGCTAIKCKSSHALVCLRPAAAAPPVSRKEIGVGDGDVLARPLEGRIYEPRDDDEVRAIPNDLAGFAMDYGGAIECTDEGLTVRISAQNTSMDAQVLTLTLDLREERLRVNAFEDLASRQKTDMVALKDEVKSLKAQNVELKSKFDGLKLAAEEHKGKTMTLEVELGREREAVITEHQTNEGLLARLDSQGKNIANLRTSNAALLTQVEEAKRQHKFWEQRCKNNYRELCLARAEIAELKKKVTHLTTPQMVPPPPMPAPIPPTPPPQQTRAMPDPPSPPKQPRFA